MAESVHDIFCLQLGALLDSSNLVLVAVLGEYRVAVVLPEGLGGVLAGEALDDAGAAGVLVNELYRQGKAVSNLDWVRGMFFLLVCNSAGDRQLRLSVMTMISRPAN